MPRIQWHTCTSPSRGTSCRPTRYVVLSRYTYVPHRGEVNQPRRGRTPQRRAFEQSGQQSLCVSPCVVTCLWWVTLNGFIDAILPDLHLLQHHHVVCPQDHDPRRAAQPVPRSQGPTGRHGRASTRSHLSARRPVRRRSGRTARGGRPIRRGLVGRRRVGRRAWPIRRE